MGRIEGSSSTWTSFLVMRILIRTGLKEPGKNDERVVACTVLNDAVL